MCCIHFVNSSNFLAVFFLCFVIWCTCDLCNHSSIHFGLPRNVLGWNRFFVQFLLCYNSIILFMYKYSVIQFVRIIHKRAKWIYYQKKKKLQNTNANYFVYCTFFFCKFIISIIKENFRFQIVLYLLRYLLPHFKIILIKFEYLIVNFDFKLKFVWSEILRFCKIFVRYWHTVVTKSKQQCRPKAAIKAAVYVNYWIILTIMNNIRFLETYLVTSNNGCVTCWEFSLFK